MEVTIKTPNAPAPLHEDTIAALVLGGDLSRLSPIQKVDYYRALCERVGLDPVTQPFTLMRLQGKEILYCGRGGVAQLTKKHEVSHKITAREMVNDIWIVTAQASTPEGRCTESIGAVPVAGLKGEALANAMMKAETKGKRRATLDLLGLGMLDESEISSIPNAISENIAPPAQAWKPAPSLNATPEPLETTKPLPAPKVLVRDVRHWEELLGAHKADALRWLVSRAWLQEGEGLEKLKTSHEYRIRTKPEVFLAEVIREAEARRRNEANIEDATLTAAQKAVRDVLGDQAA